MFLQQQQQLLMPLVVKSKLLSSITKFNGKKGSFVFCQLFFVTQTCYSGVLICSFMGKQNPLLAVDEESAKIQRTLVLQIINVRILHHHGVRQDKLQIQSWQSFGGSNRHQISAEFHCLHILPSPSPSSTQQDLLYVPYSFVLRCSVSYRLKPCLFVIKPQFTVSTTIK